MSWIGWSAIAIVLALWALVICLITTLFRGADHAAEPGPDAPLRTPNKGHRDMSKKTLAAGAAAIALGLVLTACGSGGSTTTDATATTTTSASAAETSAAAEAHNDADVMFAQMMIPHHAQAVEMSDILLASGGISEPMVALAEEIKAAQGPELAQLTGWLGQWGEPLEMPGMGHDMSTMEGMLSEQDLQDLTDAQGNDASKLFLTQMIGHHEGAITMAEDELADGQFPDALEMAQVIIDTQKQEIDVMRQLLTTL
ncbi:DUF305 domain-containing protein [Tomitella biformata]|uniref:DUF305 domain-containing protein n=1 Tax=Tomitella biformata TaxID=630403 RepID=UPI0004B98FC4|nr:DUF305 domain-containing protein [Tomitella biformata]